MIVEAKATISGSKEAVWKAITDIENAASIISGIKNIEIIEKPASGLVGLRWKETRILFGDSATVVKWITEAVENEYYKTKAEESGFVFITTLRISTGSDGVTLTSAHETKPQGIVSHLKALPMIFFKGMIRGAIQHDLNDIKAAVEKK